MKATELRKLLETVPDESLIMWKNLEGNFIGLAAVEYKPSEFLVSGGKLSREPVVVFGVEKDDKKSV